MNVDGDVNLNDVTGATGIRPDGASLNTRLASAGLLFLAVAALHGCTDDSGTPPQVTGLVEYAAVVTTPGIGTYRQIPDSADTDQRVCYWCRTDRHARAGGEECCTGSIYFGPVVTERDIVYLPEVSHRCQCPDQCYERAR